MRLATQLDRNAGQDGMLLVMSRDGLRGAGHRHYPALLHALDDWSAALPQLRALATAIEAGHEDSRPIEQHSLGAPLPRTWGFLDASAFLAHVKLARKARGVPLPDDLERTPLMYQGVSNPLLAWDEPFPLEREEFGLDFEAELGVVTTGVPQGVSPREALEFVALVVLLNDWTYRNLLRREADTGFGFVHSKPPSAFAPFAITTDELGDAWNDGRPLVVVECSRNGKPIGAVSSSEMHFSFAELIAHAAKTRPLPAGTIIGSGTIAVESDAMGSSCLVERRMREQIADGEPFTPYLKPGDEVEITATIGERTPFGTIRQRVTADPSLPEPD